MPPFSNNPSSQPSNEKTQNEIEKKSYVIHIDRTNPYVFIPSSGVASAKKGFEDKVAYENPESIRITEIDLSKVTFYIRRGREYEGEHSSSQYEGKMYMKDSDGREIHPDAKIYEILKNNPSLIPKEWEDLSRDNKAAVVFDGTDIKYDGESGHYFVMYFSQTYNEESEMWSRKRDSQVYSLEIQLHELDANKVEVNSELERVNLIRDIKARIKDLKSSEFTPGEWKWQAHLGFGSAGGFY